MPGAPILIYPGCSGGRAIICAPLARAVGTDKSMNTTQLSAPISTVTQAGLNPERVIVPVDASRESERAVDLAIRLAQQGLIEIELVALVPEVNAEDGPDPELVRAMLMETEMGFGLGEILPEPDEETRVRQRYQWVLYPLERRLNAAAIPVKLRVLHGKALGEQLRTILSVDGPRTAVVLSNPLKLFGPLRELTLEFWANPHRLTYIAGWDPVRPEKTGSWLRRMVTRFGGSNRTACLKDPIRPR
jgi:nucleotide-binding universal stress UspA family protein